MWLTRSTAVLALFAAMTAACSRDAGRGEEPAATTAPAAPTGPQLMDGLGTHHHPITTTNPEAQRFFDQGVALVFAFNHEEAVRSFQQAATLDPTAAMPHWGIAWALGPNYNLDIDDPRATQASEAVVRAVALGANASASERDYIAALAVRYSPDPKADRAALARRYAQAMGELSARYPDDLDAATLHAESLMNLRPWKLWSLDGKPAPETTTIVGILESVLRRAPNHIGANHYYIHAVEASFSPERALPSAERLKTLAPAAGHLVHMPAHILARTGDHEGAARANLAGAEADREYLKTAPAEGFYGMAYYSHNLHFLADSHMMQGRLADARVAAAELSERLLPHAQMMPMIESMALMPMSVLLRFGRYDEILKLPEPPSDRPVIAAWWRFARGVALARTGQVDAAATERAQLVTATARVPESALFGGTGLESASSILGLARQVLDARIAWAKGAQAEAIGVWEEAVRMADRVAYDEPPVWFYPLRESLGAALLQAGRAEEAERVFREDLRRHPRNPRSLLGLSESLTRQGKLADAAWVSAAHKDAWRNADSALSVGDL
jgi:tetratricopeptide (TPR) repeat protein